jgi:iron complex outermembrane receptor protein
LQYNAKSNIGDTPVQWAAGYEYDRSTERRQGGAASEGEKSTTTRDEDNTASNSDLFIQGMAMLSDRWSLTGGLRHSSVRFESKDYYITDANPDGSGAVSYSATNPVFGLTWHAAETLNIYANLGKGFETPTLAEVAYRDSGSEVVATFNTGLSASTSRHLEIGTKWTPDPQSRVDIALFRINTSDEIVVSRSANGQSAFKNAPETIRSGIELGAHRILTPHWHARLSASVMEAKFSTTSLDGKLLPGIPQHFVFGELLWNQQRIGAAKSHSGLQAGVELIDVGRLYANDTNSASVPGYTVLNLKASQAWRVGKGHLTAYARVDNVTDRNYVGSVIVNQAASQFYEPAPGRNWTVGLRLNVPL